MSTKICNTTYIHQDSNCICKHVISSLNTSNQCTKKTSIRTVKKKSLSNVRIRNETRQKENDKSIHK